MVQRSHYLLAVGLLILLAAIFFSVSSWPLDVVCHDGVRVIDPQESGYINHYNHQSDYAGPCRSH